MDWIKSPKVGFTHGLLERVPCPSLLFLELHPPPCISIIPGFAFFIVKMAVNSSVHWKGGLLLFRLSSKSPWLHTCQTYKGYIDCLIQSLWWGQLRLGQSLSTQDGDGGYEGKQLGSATLPTLHETCFSTDCSLSQETSQSQAN